MAMKMNDIIYKKREGGKLSKEEIDWFITGYVAGDIPDYQVSALLMAIFLGHMGIDRFYLGYIGMGILKLLTGGGFGILWLADIIRIAIGNLRDANGNELI